MLDVRVHHVNGRLLLLSNIVPGRYKYQGVRELKLFMEFEGGCSVTYIERALLHFSSPLLSLLAFLSVLSPPSSMSCC